jgi:hypothetical protein
MSPRTFSTAGTFAVLGPISCQAPAELGPAASAFQAFCAAMVWSMVTSAAG